jgi:outer membrane protein insertion porin family
LLRLRPRPRRRDVRRAAAVLVAALLGIPGMVAARSDLESQLKSVVSVELRGRHAVGRRDIHAVVKTRPPSIWPWGERRTLRADFLKSDCEAIELLYRQHGYLDAHVRDSLVQARDPGRIRVLFLIDEGRCSRIATVSFEGLGAVAPEALRRALYARPRRPFNPAYLVGDTAIIAMQEGERGHLPRVVGAARRDEQDSLRVHVTYHVDEGPLYRVGEVRLAEAGALRVRERHVRRELLLRPGSVFRLSRVEESEERLYETGYFSEVRITPRPDSVEPRMDFLVHVRERKRHWLDAGVGSGTQERLRVVGEWGSRSLGRQGLPGYLGAQLALDQHADLRRFLLLRGEATLVVPWLFGTRNRSQVTVYAEKRRDFRIDTLEIAKRGHGVTFQVQRKFGRRTYVRLTQDNTWVTDQDLKFLDVSLPVSFRDSVQRELLPSYSTHRLQLSGERDHRDNPLLTGRGSLQVASAELAGGPFKGSTSFTKFQASASWFAPLHRQGWVLATRVRGGVVKPFGERKDFVPTAAVDREVARVPTEDVFRLGGVNSVRGYAENEIASTGGLALLCGNAELRVPVVGLFGVELYVDAGNVWTRPEFIRMSDFTPRLGRAQLEAGDVRYVYGVGGRFNLAFAPVRLDVTWGAEPGHRRGAVQFAVGPSF